MCKAVDAVEFATKAHAGQTRKYTGENYVEHPIKVADIFCRFFNFGDLNDNAVVAAILHDTVEDCDITYDQIIELFGDTVASYVWFLTKPEAFVGNRATRKTLDRARLRVAPGVVKAIKICDLYHNTQGIAEHDLKFWKTYKTETLELLAEADMEAVIHTYSKNEKARYELTCWIELLRA